MSNLWLEFVNRDLCGLCGNTGYVDTRDRAISAAGIECGVRRPCICPNGRSIKEHGEIWGVVVAIRERH